MQNLNKTICDVNKYNTLIYIVVRQWGFCLITGKPGPESDLLYVAGTTRRWVDHSPATYQIILRVNIKLKGR